MKKTLRRLSRLAVVYLLLIGICVPLAVPLVWLVSTSFKPRQEIFSIIPQFIPSQPTLNNYLDLLAQHVSVYVMNSVIVAVGTSILGVTVTSLAAYSLSRFRFKGRQHFMIFILSTQMFPSVFFLAPMFVLLKTYGLLNSLLGLVIAYSTFVIPFSTWMLKGYFDGIPIELEESAMCDGCSRLGALRRITLPLSAPGLATVVLFCFLLGWQEFLFAVSFITDDKKRTLPVAVANSISNQYGAEWGNAMAMGAIASVPIVIIFMFFQRYIVQGLTAGAVKG